MALIRGGRLLCAFFCYVGIAEAQPTSDRPAFLGADVFGGFPVLVQPVDDESQLSFTGWEAGGTVRLRPWWGVKGTIARTSGDRYRQWQYLGGTEVNHSKLNLGARYFAHALVGYITERAPDGTSPGSAEFVVGGGFDYSFLRVQLDYARGALPDRSKNNLRVFLGGVVPLCFSECRPDDQDGIPIRQRRNP